jgi:hypothetical protein
MFIDEGFARGCDPGDAKSIAAAIGTYIENLPGMRAAGEAGRQRIRKAWNYESVFKPVLERLSNTGSAITQAIDPQLENAR